jgi:hypothetical protein
VEAELKASYPDSNIRLIRGGGGIFDVKCNGVLVYSKQNSKGQREGGLILGTTPWVRFREWFLSKASSRSLDPA